MIVAIYARVSTSEQELNNQITQLEQLAKFRGYLVHGIYTDKASGKDGNRPGWQKLLKDAKNRNFSRVLVVSISLVQSHTFRRSAITELYLSGVPAKDCMFLSGHKSLRAFETYVRTSKEQAADRMKDNPFFK